MSQPLDRNCTHPQLGELDEAAGEFWIGNPFQIAAQGENLSAYERNRLYLNVDGESFVDSSFAAGADIDSDSRSVIATDFNNDGAIDLLVGSVGGGPLRLFLNQVPQQKRLQLTLEGRASNRLAIGTRVVARIGDRQVVRDVFPVNGFMGQSPPVVDLGLGEADRIEELTIRWPSGTVQVVEDVQLGSPQHLVEPSSSN
ncbi:MAG: CRTAC1 family protein [Planctomycetes bacterium]|nr:CRTAC1 family protein [Planctomycetota bacterium]